MRIAGIVLALSMTALAAPGISAAPFCNGSEPGIVIDGEVFGALRTEAQQNTFDLMQLKRRGVDATRAERWNGCVRAFVREPDGGTTMQYFEPRTLERVF